jgi:type IV pilus assembly protein PilA
MPLPTPSGRHHRFAARAGFTVVEVVIIAAIVGIVAAIAVPWLIRARMARNEASAVVSLRQIVTAQIGYASLCGQEGYAMSLSTLSLVPPGGSQPFLEPAFATRPERDGYVFTLRPGAYATPGATDCHGIPTQNAYYASAVPRRVGRTGSAAFGASTAGTIWRLPGGTPPPEPFLPPSTPVR